jgi:hypothetical protein
MGISKKVIERAGMLLSGNDEEIVTMINAIAGHKKQNDLIDYIDCVVPTHSSENSFICGDFLELIGYGEKDKELRVFVVDVDQADDDFNKDCDDETFMTQAEMNGSVYTLGGFEQAFNNNEVSTDNAFIRIIEVHEQ